MLSEVVRPGNRVELTKINPSTISSENFSKNEKISTYFSEIYDIIEEDKIKISMPMDGAHLIAIGLHTRYEVCIYTESGLYRCKGIVVEQMKEENFDLLILELYTGVQRFQQRQHFRLECHLELYYRTLTLEEEILLKEPDEWEAFWKTWFKTGMSKGMTLDISGEGIRFLSSEQIEPGTAVFCHFSVVRKKEENPFFVLSRLFRSKKLEKRKNQYEHRVQFERISNKDRELLIQYIFEEERRDRKNKKG